MRMVMAWWRLRTYCGTMLTGSALTPIRKLPQNIKIVQFENDFEAGVKQTVENIGSFNFHPRDAFHLAYMQDLRLQAIITKDKKGFDKVPNLQVLSY